MLNISEKSCVLSCGEKYSFAKEKSHLKICKNKSYKCKYRDCGFLGKADEYMEHIEDKHSELFLVVNDIVLTVHEAKEKEKKKIMEVTDIFVDSEEESQIRPLPRTFIRSNIMPSRSFSMRGDTDNERSGDILIESISD